MLGLARHGPRPVAGSVDFAAGALARRCTRPFPSGRLGRAARQITKIAHCYKPVRGAGGPCASPANFFHCKLGEVTMTIPKWSNTGTVLRLKGQGVPRPGGTRGDEYVTLKVMLPGKPDPELEKFIAQWRPTTARNPREAMGA